MAKLVCILSVYISLSFVVAADLSGYASRKLNTDKNSLMLPLIGIRINGGAKFTNNKDIEVEVKSLKTDKSLIESMKIGFDPDLADAQWLPYSEDPLKMQLSGDDGEKRVYVQLRDKAGNDSPIESNKIVFDTSPPKNSDISINKGQKYTNDKLGRVLINAKSEEANEVILSNNPNFQNARWEPYSESLKWIVDVGGGDGEKKVFARFRDLAGNESEIVSTSIILDITPPTGGDIRINDGAKYTRSKKFKLTLRSKDATMVRIVSRGVGKNFEFKPDSNGKMDIPWISDSLQGLKSVKAYFMDEARNTTKIPAEASIIFKTTPPQKPLITVNHGRKYTNDPNGMVSVNLSAKENPQNLRMLMSNNPNFEGAKEKAFTASISNWQLNNENDGLKSIYIRLIDEANNYSEAAKADIFLDRSPPKVNTFNINGKNEWCISLSVALDCDVDDAFESQFSNNSSTLRNRKWEKFKEQRQDWTVLPGDGEKIVYARFRDEAGNVSGTVSGKIMLDMTPPTGKLIINGGNKVTNHPEGNLKLQIKHDEDVIGMQITNIPNFKEVKLLPLENAVENWGVDASDDGPKTVFLRLKDKAGNYSKIYSAGILLDRTPPRNCDLVINNNDPFVRNKNKRVSLSVRAEGADFMMISNHQSMKGGQWIPFKSAVAWTLEGPEGIHYVHAKFKDLAGNESEVISKMIKSDFAPPKIMAFSINNGAEYCADPQNKVHLTFNVEDAVRMAISNNHLKDTSSIKGLWEAYQPKKEWILEGEDGLKIVYGRFKDEAGNVTHEYYDKIVLDRIPPTDGKIAINNGEEWLTDKNGKADIYLFAKGAHEMMLSNSSDFANGKWEPMAEVRKGWAINMSRPGAEVFAKFKDLAGNTSEPVSAAIKIDVEPPKNASINIDNGNKFVTNRERKVNIEIRVDGATDMRISQNNGFRGAKWETVSSNKEIVLAEADGEKTFYVQFRDNAGNLSNVVKSAIILDTTPPKLNKFTINDGAEWTNHNEKKVNLFIDAEGAVEMMVSDNPGFSNSSWEPFKKSISNYELPGEDGEKILFVKLKDEPGNVSKVATAKINLKRTF
ncbi:MAG: hypothetical protein MI975_28805 [Cytophagales bacterium]|nr:hypothetical protein [Cytophagales bacterium]